MLKPTTKNTTWTITLGLLFALFISVIANAQLIPSGPLNEGNQLRQNAQSPGGILWRTLDRGSTFALEFVQNSQQITSKSNLPKPQANQTFEIRVYLTPNEALAAVFYSIRNINGSTIEDHRLFVFSLNTIPGNLVFEKRFALNQWPNLTHFSQGATADQGLMLVTYQTGCNVSNQRCSSFQADFFRLPMSPNGTRQTSVIGNSKDVNLQILSDNTTIQGTLGGQNFSASVPGGNSGGGNSGGGTQNPQPVDPKPAITDIDLASQIRIFGHANGNLDFTDAQGDVTNLLYVEQGEPTPFFSFDPNVQGQTSGNIQFGMFCPQRLRQSNQQTNVVVDLFLVDSQGNRSQPGTVRFTCLPAVAPQITNVQVPSSINNGEEKAASFDFTDADGDVVRALIQPTNFDPQWLNQFLPGTSFTNPQMAQQLQRKTNGRFGFNVRCPFGVVVGPLNLPTNPTMNLILQDATNQETRTQLSWNCTTNGAAPALTGDSIPSQIGIGRGENSTLSFFDAEGDIIGLNVRPLNFPEEHLSKYLQVLDQINRVSFTVGATSGVVNVNAMCQNVITSLGLTLTPEMEIVLTDANGLQSQPYNVSWTCVNQQPLALASSAQALTVQPLVGGGLNIMALASDIQSIQLDVFNTAGERVFSQKDQSGALNYQGLNDNGQALANGVYFYVITIKKSTGVTERGNIQKMMVLR